MPDDKPIPEFYSDMFEIVASPYGIVLNFSKGPPEPRMDKEVMARVRMSWEHAKAMTFIMSRHIKQVEEGTGVSYPIPTKQLSEMGIGLEDWNVFWKSET